MCRAEDANPEVAREAADGVCKISAALRRAGRQRNADKPAVQIQAARLAQGRRFDVRMPYGPVDWTVRVLHGFWDLGCPGPSGLRILIGSSPERTGSRGREISEVHA